MKQGAGPHHLLRTVARNAVGSARNTSNPDTFKGATRWSQAKRHDELVRWLRYLLTTEDVTWNGSIGAVYLFFDGYEQ
jgi:hypothetical protein